MQEGSGAGEVLGEGMSLCGRAVCFWSVQLVSASCSVLTQTRHEHTSGCRGLTTVRANFHCWPCAGHGAEHFMGIDFQLRMISCRGAWVARSVKHLLMATQVMISRFLSSSLPLGSTLTVRSRLGILSLSAPPPLALSLSQNKYT